VEEDPFTRSQTPAPPPVQSGEDVVTQSAAPDKGAHVNPASVAEAEPKDVTHEGTVALSGLAKALTEPEIARLKAIKRDGRKPKEALENPRPKGGRGHFRKQIRSQLAQSGKLNATPPMSAEQRRLRHRKRKK